MTAMTVKMKQAAWALVGAVGLMMASIAPAAAQGVESIDPDSAFGEIDGDLSGEATDAASKAADTAMTGAGDAAEDAAADGAEDVMAEANDPFAEAMGTYSDPATDPAVETPETATAGADAGASDIIASESGHRRIVRSLPRGRGPSLSDRGAPCELSAQGRQGSYPHPSRRWLEVGC